VSVSVHVLVPFFLSWPSDGQALRPGCTLPFTRWRKLEYWSNCRYGKWMTWMNNLNVFQVPITPSLNEHRFIFTHVSISLHCEVPHKEMNRVQHNKHWPLSSEDLILFADRMFAFNELNTGWYWCQAGKICAFFNNFMISHCFTNCLCLYVKLK